MADLLAGRDRIDSPLGAGGMGEVILAKDIKLERPVAIKWLRPDHGQDLVARERLRREALAAAALDQRMLAKASSDRVQTRSELRVEIGAVGERSWLAASPSQTVLGGAIERSERTLLSAATRKLTELLRLLGQTLTGSGGKRRLNTQRPAKQRDEMLKKRKTRDGKR
jgi:serine/threonine protein kinase